MVKKQTKNTDHQMIKVGYRLPSGQGRFAPEYEYREFGLPKSVADTCRRLDERRDFGVHVSKIGGLDALAELEFWNVPYDAVAKPKRGTGGRECWITTDAVFRFQDHH